jgi:hypothetical protein
MPRKRSKPADPATPATEPAAETGPATAGPDVFDQAVAARAAGQFETPEKAAPAKPDTADRVTAALAAAPVMRGSELGAPAREGTHPEPVMPKVRGRLPDPRGIETISLDADSRNGPRMRLLRSYRNHEVWIQFDKNPGKDVTEAVKAAGFRWEARAEVDDHRGAWVKPLEQGREVRIMLDAERLFRDLGNKIRQANGLEPVGMVGMGAD